MRRTFTKFIVIIITFVSYLLPAQVYNYAWMRGVPSASLAVYGSLGVTSSSNNPGSQANGITWTDASGDLWLYGGTGFANGPAIGSLNDLWKYSPGTNSWTWVNGSGSLAQPAVYGTMGIPAASNNPGGRHSSASWTDAGGNLWLFGGLLNGSICNDLWRYTISSNQWTWMGGSNTPSQTAVYGSITVPSTTNIPGASYNFVSWKDPSGNFWLYDGVDGTGDRKYNPSNAQWAWMSGTNTGTVTAVYGTMGVSSLSGHPGERWTEGVGDAAGNLYIFGGKDYTSATFTARKNDLWKYEISNNQWTWISGSQSPSSSGTYGTQGVFSSSALPPGRYGHTLWADNTNKLWVFGGEVITLVTNYEFNDTWCFDLTTGQWAWMKGSNTPFVMPAAVSGAVYGTQTVPAVSNTPGWRLAAPYWTGDPATLWIFAGTEWFNSNELWRFNGCSSPASISISSSQASLCPGSTATLSANGSGGTYNWNTGAQTSTIAVSPSSTTVYYAMSTGTANCYGAAGFTIAVQPTILSVLSSSNALCAGQSATLTASGHPTFTWNAGQTGSVIVVTPLTTTAYSVSGSGNGCASSASYTQIVNPYPVLNISSSPSVACSGNPISISASGAASYNWNSGQTAASFSAALLSTTAYTVTGMLNGCTSSASYTQIVTPNPVLNVSSSSPVTCSGNPVSISASGAASYNWNSGQTTASISVAPLSTTVYTVTGMLNGCTSSTSYTQTVNPNPMLNVSSSPPVTCSGDPMTLNASGATSYNWNNGQTAASFSSAPLSTTVYTVTGITNGCSSTTSFTQQVFPLTVLLVNGAANAICAGKPVQLIASGATTYTWTFQGSNSPVIEVSPTSTTTYTVTGTDTNGCKGESAVTVNVLNCTGFQESSREENSFSLYPNPASAEVTIKGAAGKTLKMVNSLGQLILEQKLESETEIIHERLSPGIYYCTINGAEKTVKLVIQD